MTTLGPSAAGAGNCFASAARRHFVRGPAQRGRQTALRMAAFQFEVAFSEPQIRRAVRAFYGHILKRQLDWKLYVAIGIVVVALILVEMKASDGSNGRLGARCSFVAAFLYFFYRAYLQQSI